MSKIKHFVMLLLFASVVSGTDLGVPARALDSGGGAQSAGPYANHASIGGIIGASNAGETTIESGFIAQRDVVSAIRFMIELIGGWNLISTPIELLDKDVDVVFHESSVDAVFEIVDGVYVPATIMRPGRGYWAHALVADDVVEVVVVEGVPVAARQQTLTSGWGIVGPVLSPPFDPVLLDSSSRDAFNSVVWGWDGTRYYVATRFEAGKGYFVSVASDADVLDGRVAP